VNYPLCYVKAQQNISREAMARIFLSYLRDFLRDFSIIASMRSAQASSIDLSSFKSSSTSSLFPRRGKKLRYINSKVPLISIFPALFFSFNVLIIAFLLEVASSYWLSSQSA